jgi:hypothetical protein
MKLTFIVIIILLSGCTASSDYKNGQKLDWKVAKKFITANPDKIDNVVQAHSLDINILLKNGDILKTKEMYIDEIFDVLRKCGKPCKHIGWITQ